MSDIYESFKGRTVFFTGVTGFVGKVFLWKLLKEFADLESAIVLIRTKKGQNPQDRLKKEVLSSPCFEPLKKQLGDAEWTRRSGKVVAVSGDIMDDKLGMSEADYAMVVAKVTHIVHMAATVNFDERLDISVKMNVLGSLRVMALASRAPKLEAYVHMSTCYVNWKRKDRQVVRETIYPLEFDAEDMCKFILSQDPTVMHLVSPRVLKQYNFPNTYTFTKAMGEQILERRKGNLPLTIIRPAIVGCALREPMTGWVDALTAAGGIYLTAGLGILRELFIRGDNIADVIPVDYVVNTTIKLLHRTATFYNQRKVKAAPPLKSVADKARGGPVAVAVGGKGDASGAVAAAAAGRPGAASSQQRLMALNAVSSGSSAGTVDGVSPSIPFVYQSSTSSSLNVMRWETAGVAVHAYWNAHPHPKAIHPCDMTIVENYWQYRFRLFTRRVLPLQALKLALSLPLVGNPERKKLVQRLEKAVFRSIDMQRQFSPFMNNEWCFDATNTNGLDEYILPEQVKRFSCDVYDINWIAYTNAYSYGMMKYIMKSAEGRSAPLIPQSGSEAYAKANL